MTKVVSIKFKTDGRAYFFDPDTFTLSVGMQVIVETARGIECGVVSEGIRSVSEDQIVKPLKKVIRIEEEKFSKTICIFVEFIHSKSHRQSSRASQLFPKNSGKCNFKAISLNKSILFFMILKM